MLGRSVSVSLSLSRSLSHSCASSTLSLLLAVEGLVGTETLDEETVLVLVLCVLVALCG